MLHCHRDIANNGDIHETSGLKQQYHPASNNEIVYYYLYLENQNPKNSSGQHKNLRYFGKNKKTSVFDWRPRVLILNPYLTRT